MSRNTVRIIALVMVIAFLVTSVGLVVFSLFEGR